MRILMMGYDGKIGKEIRKLLKGHEVIEYIWPEQVPDDIEIFIHTAGIPITMKPIDKLTWNDFNEQIDIYLRSMFEVIQILSKDKKFKRVIFIQTSMFNGKVLPYMPHYLVAKYSQEGLMKGLERTLKITFNSISAELINSDLTSQFPETLLIKADKKEHNRVALEVIKVIKEK